MSEDTYDLDALARRQLKSDRGVKRGFLAACLAADLTALLPLFILPHPHFLVTMSVLLLAGSALGWTATYYLGRVPLMTDVAQAGTIAFAIMATRLPATGLAISVGPLLFGSLFGRPWRTAWRTVLYGTVFLVVVTLVANNVPGRISILPSVIFSLALLAVAQRTLVTTMAARAELARRQDLLARLASRLLAATTPEEITELLVTTAVLLLPGDDHAEVGMNIPSNASRGDSPLPEQRAVTAVRLGPGENQPGEDWRPGPDLASGLGDTEMAPIRLEPRLPERGVSQCVGIEISRERAQAGELVICMQRSAGSWAAIGPFVEMAARQAAMTFERVNATAELGFRARFDELTKLARRSEILAEIGRLDPTGAAGTALLAIGLEGLSDVNDAYGHVAGDEVLLQAAQRLRSLLGPEDFPAVLGPDAFAVLLCGGEGPGRLHSFANAVRSSMGTTFVLQSVTTCSGEPVRVGLRVSLGTAELSGLSAGEALRRADLAMYVGRSRGQSSLTTYSEQMNSPVATRAQLSYELKRAMDNHEFFLAYQPEVALADGEVVAVEALIRWQHPSRGTLPPDEFIPFAEQSGAIFQLGDWVLNRACTELASWRSKGRAGKVKMAINLSALQLTDPLLLDRVLGAAAKAGIRPKDLVLEVTESIALHGAQAIELLGAVRAEGAAIAIDDFGTGYSSLSYLAQVPADVIKIDRSFVAPAMHSDADRYVLEAIVALAHSLGCQIVAEGIESRAEAVMLKDLGCQVGQGFFFGKPEPGDAWAIDAIETTERSRQDRHSGMARFGLAQRQQNPLPEHP